MTTTRIITSITENGTKTCTGKDANEHLNSIDIDTNTDDSFVKEVERKVNNNKETKE